MKAAESREGGYIQLAMCVAGNEAVARLNWLPDERKAGQKKKRLKGADMNLACEMCAKVLLHPSEQSDSGYIFQLINHKTMQVLSRSLKCPSQPRVPRILETT